MESVGQWRGKAAEYLGLSGDIDLKAFRSLLHNRLSDGSKWRPRESPNQRALYDFTFSAPKSVAIAHQIGGDTRIAEAMRGAVMDTMRSIEKRAMTRVRRITRRDQEVTGNIAWVDFYHKLSRPVKGIPDPGDHIHATVLNGTWHNGKWYSLELEKVVSDSGYWRAEFHNNLARRMRELGYTTRRTETAFELKEVPERLIREFSQRREQLIHKARVKAPKGRAAIAAISREKKAEIKADKLFNEWLKRLRPDERKLMGSLTSRIMQAQQDEIPLFDNLHLTEALGRLLDNRSAVPERALMTEAMRAGVGEVTPEGLEQALQDGEYIRAEVDGVSYVTTPEAVRKEQEILAFAKQGRITLQRTHAGETVKAGDNDILVEEAQHMGFEKLYSLMEEAKESGARLLLHATCGRDYRDPGRGDPLAMLEDLAGLPTGQKRPRPKIVEKAAKAGRAVKDKLAKQMERLRSQHSLDTQAEAAHGRDTRQNARER